MTPDLGGTDPPLSIVIPCHNRADLLRDCLAGVTRFAPPRTQVIVVDDASPDGIASRTASEFAGVESIRLADRGGFCVAVNRGIAAAKAPIVELLNDDTEVEPGWADAALACFDDPQVVAVAPLVLKRDGRPGVRIDSAGDSYHLGGFARKRGHDLPLGEFPIEAGPVFGASASSAFYRRDSLLRVGAFPESFGSYFEDVDVSFRLRRAGGGIVFEPRSRVWHRVGASHGVPDRRLAEQQSRNEERVFWRNIPLSQMWRALPLHAAVLLAKAWRRWREGRLTPFFVGRLKAMSEMRRSLDQRRRLARIISQNPHTSG
jgi:GT2 family glycosyltransferase